MHPTELQDWLTDLVDDSSATDADFDRARTLVGTDA
jgi:hypothetical protein